jgi:hypothetical protein
MCKILIVNLGVFSSSRTYSLLLLSWGPAVNLKVESKEFFSQTKFVDKYITTTFLKELLDMNPYHD